MLIDAKITRNEMDDVRQTISGDRSAESACLTRSLILHLSCPTLSKRCVDIIFGFVSTELIGEEMDKMRRGKTTMLRGKAKEIDEEWCEGSVLSQYGMVMNC